MAQTRKHNVLNTTEKVMAIAAVAIIPPKALNCSNLMNGKLIHMELTLIYKMYWFHPYMK